jgi:putative glycosyl hydrolase-like family 15 (GHL15) protein
MGTPEHRAKLRRWAGATGQWATRVLCCVLVMVLCSACFGAASERDVRGFVETPYPRIAMLWAPIRGERSVASMTRHDLIMGGVGRFGLRYDREPTGLAEAFTADSIARAREGIAEMRRLNRDVVILVELYFYEYRESWLPAGHPWWLRKDGQRQQFWPGTYRMDWSNPEYRHHVVKLTKALEEIGFDGVFYDNLRDEPEPWVAFLKEVRHVVGDGFLILANAGYAVGRHDFAAPYLNGMMYESGWSHERTEWADCIAKMQHTQTLLREPKISLIERFEEIRSRAGWPGDAKRGQKPPADPQARRWSLCYALAVGDFYYLFSDNTSHRHDWYPEYDVKIGLPIGPSERIGPYVWRRAYEKALVVVNLPGASAPYEVRLEAQAKDSLTGRTGTEFIVQPADGAILIAQE